VGVQVGVNLIYDRTATGYDFAVRIS